MVLIALVARINGYLHHHASQSIHGGKSWRMVSSLTMTEEMPVEEALPLRPEELMVTTAYLRAKARSGAVAELMELTEAICAAEAAGCDVGSDALRLDHGDCRGHCGGEPSACTRPPGALQKDM